MPQYITQGSVGFQKSFRSEQTEALGWKGVCFVIFWILLSLSVSEVEVHRTSLQRYMLQMSSSPSCWRQRYCNPGCPEGRGCEKRVDLSSQVVNFSCRLLRRTREAGDYISQ